MNGITVTLVHVTKTGINARGNAVYAETTEDIGGCAFQPGQTSEQTQGAEELIANGRLWIPIDESQVTFNDKVIINGRTYQVDGMPKRYTSPFSGTSAPLQLDLKEVEGVTAHQSGGAG